MKFLSLVLLAIFLYQPSAHSEVKRANDDDLTFLKARERKSMVQSVAYDLDFHFKKNSETFSAKALLKLSLNEVKAPLSIDLMGKKITSVKVNGVELKKYPTRIGSFDIPQKNLALKTQIEVVYTGTFSKSSGGILKSVDPQDGSEYIYTDFEPYQAHQLFPCIDQPDLKANFHVTVTAPKDWKVIQNELVDTVKTSQDESVTTFKTTPLISTYLFFVGAGPFVEWKEMAGDIPMYLYARKTLEKFVDADKIFETTRKGLKFYNSYFGTKYPFSKYGQLFIPEFAWGGMENPGAVTLNERNIFRGPVPVSIYEKRDDLILHEMAHQWFGDLVTMQWWNDLWLNESFATYLASVAQERAMKSEGTWLFFYSTKLWGYWQDQLVTTHPIETNVPDVRTARGNFDGITYAKGASALKQLHFFVGEEGFQKGLEHYFKTYAFKNTERKDFIDSIAKASGKDLNDWTNKWLQTAGPNKVVVDFTCDEGKVKTFHINQKANVSKALSPHRTRLSFYNKDDDELELNETLDVVYSAHTTEVKEAIGKKCPDFVLPNKDDKDYALYSLDEKSLAQSALAMTTLPDPLSRMMVWSILGQMVRDQKLKPMNFMLMAIEGLDEEEDNFLLGNILGKHSSIKAQYVQYLTVLEREQLAPKMDRLLTKRILESKPGSSMQMNFYDFFIAIAQSKEALDQLANALKNNQPPKGITLDQDRRWAILMNLASNGYEGTQGLIEEEMKRDPSTLGKRMAYAATAALPDMKIKKKYWSEYFGKEKVPFSNFRESAEKFHGPNQEALTSFFAKDFFQKVTHVNWKQHDDDVEIYFEKLYPLQQCQPGVLKMSKSTLAKARNLTTLARRGWLEAQDELERCVKVRTQLVNNTKVK